MTDTDKQTGWRGRGSGQIVFDVESRRHVLHGRELHCGDELQTKIKALNGKDGWIWVRYEASWSGPGEPRVTWHSILGLLRLDADAEFRWKEAE